MRTLRRGAALVALAVATGLGCGVGADGTARAIDPAKVPPGLGATSTTTAAVGQTDIDLTQPAELWFIRADRLVAIDRRVPIGTAPEGLLEELVRGPTADERNQSLRSALLDLDLYSSPVRASSGVVTVDLTQEFSRLPSTEQLLAVGQIVGSLTSLPGVGLVSFRLAGEPVDVPVGDGSQAQGPVSRDDYAELEAT